MATKQLLSASTNVVKLAHLKMRRERLALSQQELALQTGLSKVTISQLENLKRDPRPKTTRVLAEVLKCSPAELMAS